MKKLFYIITLSIILVCSGESVLADYYPYDFKKDSFIFSCEKGTYIIHHNSNKLYQLNRERVMDITQNDGLIYYSSDRYTLKRMNISTGMVKTYRGIHPDWYFKYIKNGKIYLPGSSGSEPYDYYVMDLDGKGLKKLFSGMVVDAFLDGNILYIVGYDKNRKQSDGRVSVYRITPEGNRTVYLLDDHYIGFDGDWIYFADEKSSLQRVKKDFSRKEKINFSLKESSIINIDFYSGHQNFSADHSDKDFIYFVVNKYNDNHYELCSLNRKTRKVGTLLIEDVINGFKIKNGAIFYSYEKRNKKYLAKYDLRSKKKLMISSMDNADFAIDSKYAYFQVNNGVYRALFDGKGKKVLTKGVALKSQEYADNINKMFIKDGWLYFEAGDSLYRIKTDGTGKTMLSDRKTFSYFFYHYT